MKKLQREPKLKPKSFPYPKMSTSLEGGQIGVAETPVKLENHSGEYKIKSDPPELVLDNRQGISSILSSLYPTSYDSTGPEPTLKGAQTMVLEALEKEFFQSNSKKLETEMDWLAFEEFVEKNIHSMVQELRKRREEDLSFNRLGLRRVAGYLVPYPVKGDKSSV